MQISPRQFVARLPVEERGSRLGGLYALGVQLWLEPPCRIPEDLYWRIYDALAAERQAAGVNMPVALCRAVWLHRCRRCNAPFIGPSEARLCSDECRAAATRDALARSKAKRAAGAIPSPKVRGRIACHACGKPTGRSRPTRRYCSVKCRVAWHRRKSPAEKAAPSGDTPAGSLAP
jgi:hypothetical protein